MSNDVKEGRTAGDLESIVSWVLAQGIQHEIEGIDVVLLKQLLFTRVNPMVTNLTSTNSAEKR